MKTAHAAGILVIVIAVVAVAVFFLYTPSGAQNNVVVSLTDPANVPSGTQSLNITYSSLSVHTIGVNTSGWTNFSNTGSVNLLTLANSSITLGSFSAPNGTLINLVKFNVSSASIAINNTIYPVTLPSGQIVAHINGTKIVNGTAKVLMDLSPTIVTIVTANSTIFIMVPSIRAVLVPHPVSVDITPGAIAQLHSQDRIRLEDITPNISITSASISNLNNITTLHVTVKDNSNTSVVLRHVLVLGNESLNLPKFNITGVREGYRGSIEGGVSIGQPSGITISARGYSSDFTNGTNQTSGNHSNETIGATNETEIENEFINMGQNIARMRTLTFQINSNGTLFIPYLQCTQQIGGNGEDIGPTPAHSVCPAYVNYSAFRTGFVLNSNQSVTLTFTGSLVLGEGNYQVNVVPGNAYNLIVQGENGARAQTLVNAT